MPVSSCISEETIGAINEAVIGTEKSTFLFSYFMFYYLTAPSINRLDFSRDSNILIISSISSFDIRKLNPIPALRVSCPLYFLSNLSNIGEIALVVDLGNTSLAKETTNSISAFYLRHPSCYQEIRPIDNCALVSFILVDILILIFCLVVKNNSCGNSSFWKCFLVILNFAPVLFFAAYFRFLCCRF